MTPTEIRATREALGLTPQGLASALRCTARAVRMWEQGTRNAPGPAVVAMELLLSRHRLERGWYWDAEGHYYESVGQSIMSPPFQATNSPPLRVKGENNDPKEPSAAGSGHAPNVPMDGASEGAAHEGGADSVPMDGEASDGGERAMTRFVIERRNAGGEVIERTAPFVRGDMEGKRAEIHQHQIAELHNRSRSSADVGRQLVYRVEERQ